MFLFGTSIYSHLGFQRNHSGDNTIVARRNEQAIFLQRALVPGRQAWPQIQRHLLALLQSHRFTAAKVNDQALFLLVNKEQVVFSFYCLVFHLDNTTKTKLCGTSRSLCTHNTFIQHIRHGLYMYIGIHVHRL